MLHLIMQEEDTKWPKPHLEPFCTGTKGSRGMPFFGELDVSDPAKLFRMVKRANGVDAEPTLVLCVDGTIYKGDGLLHAWAKYFKTLATPLDSNFDLEFYEHISEQYSGIGDIPLDIDDFTPFTIEEVTEVVLSLKLNKAAGPDDIDPKHLRYGGEALIGALVILFNAIVSSGYIPTVFRCGLVIPIPKGHSKQKRRNMI